MAPGCDLVCEVRNGMQLANLSGDIQNIVIGGLLLGAIVAGNLIRGTQSGRFRPRKLLRGGREVRSGQTADGTVLVDPKS